MHTFTKKLLNWHAENHRHLPWSGQKRDPYSIWLSEIIMQQTRIEQGTSYYLKFIKKYPTVQHLSKAKIDEVMRLWEGLGYYTRARNLHKAANHIVKNLGGKFPDNYEGLLSLPGIGPYSAAAISSFAYGHKHVVVDGNVKRLIARFNGIHESIDDPSTYKDIHAVAFAYLNGADPALFNQAIMNFGALVCKPKPDCENCPLAAHCYAHCHNVADLLPVRNKKKENRLRYFHFIVIHHRGKIIMQRREENDIWKGLYTPLVIETNSLRKPSLRKSESFLKDFTDLSPVKYISSSDEMQQILSHQTIHGRFHHFELLKSPEKQNGSAVWVNHKTLADLAKPKIIHLLFSRKKEACFDLLS